MTEQISTPPKESLPAVPLFDSLTIHHWPSLFSHDWTLNPQHLTLSKYSKQLLLHRMNVFLLNFQLLASPISLLNSSDTICLIAKLPHNSSTDLKPLRNKTKKSSKLEKKMDFLHLPRRRHWLPNTGEPSNLKGTMQISTSHSVS